MKQYQGYCKCGWEGTWWVQPTAAIEETSRHNETEHIPGSYMRERDWVNEGKVR